MKFHEGDAVRLCAGGPLMTVQGAVGDLLLCSWVDPAGRVRRETYAPRQLVHGEATELLAVRALKRLAFRWTLGATL